MPEHKDPRRDSKEKEQKPPNYLCLKNLNHENHKQKEK